MVCYSLVLILFLLAFRNLRKRSILTGFASAIIIVFAVGYSLISTRLTGAIEGNISAGENDLSDDRPALVCLDNVDAAGSLTEWLGKNVSGMQNVVAAIGSERGWSKKERQLLEQYGFIRLSMGSRVLRTETASTVAASLILSAMGALN